MINAWKARFGILFGLGHYEMEAAITVNGVDSPKKPCQPVLGGFHHSTIVEQEVPHGIVQGIRPTNVRIEFRRRDVEISCPNPSYSDTAIAEAGGLTVSIHADDGLRLGGVNFRAHSITDARVLTLE